MMGIICHCYKKLSWHFPAGTEECLFLLCSHEIEVMFSCINQTNVIIKNIIGQNKMFTLFRCVCVCERARVLVHAGCNLVNM
jgi:hypothetical protein